MNNKMKNQYQNSRSSKSKVIGQQDDLHRNVSDDGCYTEIYTLSSDERLGKDNIGHNIPEILTLPDDFPATTSSSQHLTLPATNNMTPISAGSRFGKRTVVAFDITVEIIVAICILLVELGVLPHVQTGFFCNDPTISFKHNGEVISTASILISIFIPFFLLWICEASFYKPVSVKSTRLKKSLMEAFYWFKKYFIGMSLQILIVSIIKVFIGEQRPHFLDTCKPDAAFNCTGSEYIYTYRCTNTQLSITHIRDSSKSFPSGHAAISFFEAVFLIWYLHRKSPPIKSQLLLPIINTLLLAWACICSATRITDHRHHWWDVLCGTFIGIALAVFTCLALCKDFKRRNVEIIIQNGNADRHTSVRRLLSDISTRDEVTMNHVVVP